MKLQVLQVVSESVTVKFPMWAVSVSAPPSVEAMFADEGEARAYATEKRRRYSHVRVLMVTAIP